MTTDPTGPVTDQAPLPPGARSGAPWLDAEHAVLVAGLRAGEDEHELAIRLGRTTEAVLARLRLLLPPEETVSRPRLLEWLQEELEDEDYDWRAALRAHAQRANRVYFDSDDDELLRQAWQQRRPLPELAGELGVDELTLARQLTALQLAGTLAEVVQRLGATPGSVLDHRVRLNTERTSVPVWVLVVDGLVLTADQPAEQVPHVSLHDTEQDARTLLEKLLDRHIHPERTVSQVRWTIAERTIAGGAVGPAEHDRLLPFPDRGARR